MNQSLPTSPKLVVGMLALGGVLLLLAGIAIAFSFSAIRQARDAELQSEADRNLQEVGRAIEQLFASEVRIEVVPGAREGETARLDILGLRKQELEALERSEFDREGWSRILAVRVAADETTELPAMLGDYRIEGDRLVFAPRFPFEPGLKYRAMLDLTMLPGTSNAPARVVTREFSLPEPPPLPQTVVKHVYPSRNVLPENQLKFYVHFSAPMSRGEAYDRIHLLDANGNEVEYPFLELGEELWGASGTRFTLFFDPGRIKRGLKPREDVGPALEAGKSYTLVVDADWRDANGKPLKQPFRKQFTVVEPDETQPDPQDWELSVPSVGTREPFAAAFPEPLDHAMLLRVLEIQNLAGNVVRGAIEVADGETGWRLSPDAPWTSGRYSLVVDTTLEDLAGNSIGRPFEVDMTGPVETHSAAKTVSLPFEIVSATAGP